MLENSELETKFNKVNVPDDDIDILGIFKILLRNKRFISQLTLISLIAGILYSFSLKKIWQGQFQIVVTQVSNKTDTEFNILSGLPFNLPKEGDPLQTEVGILKSPLVLDKVFNYIKEKKSENGIDISNLTFNKWKNKYLNVELEEDTTILNLSYSDTNQDLILPVLQKISKSYQDYSGRSRLRKINLGKTYLEKQISIFKESSKNSLRKAQEFAMEENLSILQGQAELDKEIPNQINIEAIRIKSANKIRDIEMQLKELKDMNDPESLMYMGSFIPELMNQGLPQELDGIDRKIIRLNSLKEEIINFKDDPKKIQYFGNSIPQLLETGLPEQLRQIETDIEFKKFIYKDNDKSIKDLLKKRQILIKVFKDQAINYIDSDIEKLNTSKPKLITLLKLKTEKFLKARKSAEESILKAAERPKGVILKYRELLGIAKKDAATLENLELNYRALLLEEAKTEDPWELITTPTLLKYPVSPNKKNIAAFSFLIGLLSACILALIIENRKKIIFDSNKLKKEFNLPFILELSTFNKKIFANELILLFKSSYLINEEKIIFIKESNIEEAFNNELEKIIRFQNYRIQKINDYITQDELTKVIIMPILGKTKINEIKRDVDKLHLLGVKIIGIVSIKENNNENIGIKLKDEFNLIIEFLLNSIKANIRSF